MRKALAALFLALSLVPAFAQPPPVPALPDTERRTSYSISATTCACSVGFALYEDSTDIDQQISVWINGTQVLSSSTTSGWTLTSATGSFAAIPRPITNAVLTFNASQTGTVQIVGAARPRRLSQFAENRGVAARDLNQVLTYLTAMERERWDRDSRVLQGLPGETITPLPSATSRAGGLLAFDGSGNPVATAAGTGTGNVVGPASSINGDVACFDGTTGILLKDCGAIGTTTLTGDITGGPSVGTVATTLATVNSNVGTFGTTSIVPQITVNGKGLVTAVSGVTVTPGSIGAVPTSRQVIAGSGMTGGGALSGDVTLGMATIADKSILANNTGGAAAPSALSASQVLDFLSATQGTVLYRDATGWVALAPGSSGQLLTTAGAGANPSWTTASGTGTVTSVTAGAGLSGGAITATGTVAMLFDPGSITNCTLAATVSGNALTVALKTQAGADPSSSSPCVVSFRNGTVATGDYTAVSVTSATTFATGVSGSTFGVGNNTPFRLWVTAWNNGGAVAIGVSNQSTSTVIAPLNEAAMQTSFACNACPAASGATSAATFFTTAALTTKAVRILGYMDWASGLGTAGVWASGPTTIQMMGPGIKKPGDIIQTIYATSTTSVGAGANYTPSNTLPTIANAALCVTAPAYTPTAAPNHVRIFANALGGNNVSNVTMTGFIGNGSTAIAVNGAMISNNAVAVVGIPVDYEAINPTSATTYSAYINGNTGTTSSNAINGGSSALWGGLGLSRIRIEEIMG